METAFFSSGFFVIRFTNPPDSVEPAIAAAGPLTISIRSSEKLSETYPLILNPLR